MKWVGYNVGQWHDLRHLFHIPNGGLRNKVVATKMKAEGVKPGVSDYFLPVPAWDCDYYLQYHGLWIELKAQKKYPTTSQREFLNDMRQQGYAAYWCMGWEEASQILLQYLRGDPITGRD